MVRVVAAHSIRSRILKDLDADTDVVYQDVVAAHSIRSRILKGVPVEQVIVTVLELQPIRSVRGY